MSNDALEARMRSLEDRVEIGELIVRYALLVDDAQWTELAELFTEDAVLASASFRVVGRAAIIDSIKAQHEPYTATWHDPHGRVVELDDESHARGTVISRAELARADVTMTASIRYHDDYRREDGRWRFAARLMLSMYAMPVTEFVAGGFGRQERKLWPGRPASIAELPDYEQRYPGYPT